MRAATSAMVCPLRPSPNDLMTARPRSSDRTNANCASSPDASPGPSAADLTRAAADRYCSSDDFIVHYMAPFFVSVHLERPPLSPVPPASANSPRYHSSINLVALWQEFPPAPDFFQSTWMLSADELRALQNQRFLRQMQRAWQVPFYKRHWGAHGLEAGDVRSLEDLDAIRHFRCTICARRRTPIRPGWTTSASTRRRMSRCR